MKKVFYTLITLILSLTLVASPTLAKGGGGGGGGGSSSGGSKGGPSSSSKAGSSKANSGKQDTGKVANDSKAAKDNKISMDSKKENEKAAAVEKQQDKQQAKSQKRDKLREQLKDYEQKVNESGATTTAFTDTKKHWAQKAIDRMKAIGVMGGYEDGTFKPNDPITQAEVIAVTMRALVNEEPLAEDTATEDAVTEETAAEDATDDATAGETEDVADDATPEEEADIDEGVLEDVPDWAKGVTEKAARKGILNMNRYHSRVQATRAQSAVWIAKAMELEPVDTSTMPFQDCTLMSAEDAGYIMALYNEGYISGTSDDTFNPNSSITRAQIAAIMERILSDQEQQDSDSVENGDDTESVEESETTESSDTAESSDTTESTDATESSDTTESADATSTTVSEGAIG